MRGTSSRLKMWGAGDWPRRVPGLTPTAARAGALLVILVAAVGTTVWSTPEAATDAAAESGQQPMRARPNPSQQPALPPSPSAEPGPTPLTAKQKQALLKDNFEKMKREADELTELAKSLQAELDKSNEGVLSLQVVSKAGQIERLAKKIKNTATAY